MRNWLALLAACISLGCQGGGAPIGLQETDYFVYMNPSDSDGRVHFLDEYRVIAVSASRIEVQRTTIQIVDGAETRKPGLTYSLDTSGVIRETSAPKDASLKGLDLKRQLQLWLPPSKRVAGKVVSFAGTIFDFKVQGEGHFAKWDVWTATYGGERLHFDQATGWLVGGVRGGAPVVLASSSRDL
jgi:hypothetical protein